MMNRKALVRSRMARLKKGFTLTEIAIVLGIIGLILGAIWVAAASVYNAQRLNHATTATLQIAQGVRALFATSSTTGATALTDATSAMVTANIIPNDLIDVAASGTTLGPFPGGKTGVVFNTDGGGFAVVMSGLTKAACINLLVSVGGTSRDPGLYQADAVSSTSVATSDGVAVTPTALTAAITPTAAVTSCSNTLNKVRFGFTLK